MPLKIIKKDFFIKQINNIVYGNCFFNRMSWVILFENNKPILYKIDKDIFKSKNLSSIEWEKEGLLKDLDWHIVKKIMIKIKSSKEKNFNKDLLLYLLTPEYNIDKLLNCMGNFFLEMVKK